MRDWRDETPEVVEPLIDLDNAFDYEEDDYDEDEYYNHIEDAM